MKDDAKEIREIVKEKYGEIARRADEHPACGCSCSCETGESWTVDLDYSGTDGYVPEADLRLGCGLPVKHAGITPGDIVVDLGSGAGNDVFVARRIVGDAGRVIGIDMTPEMIDKARCNNAKLGYANVEFRAGNIEALPVEGASTDVVVSNCVLNLVPDKRKAFAEIMRILKPGGHFCVSDMVLKGELPEKLRGVAEMYAGCVSGALQEDEYLGIIQETGFVDVDVRESRRIEIPDNVLKGFLDDAEIAFIRRSGFQVLSITVTAARP
jgi:SAM-dependent methyltransferase